MAQKIYIGGTYNEPIYDYGTPVTLTINNIHNYCAYQNNGYQYSWYNNGGYWWSQNAGIDDSISGMDWTFSQSGKISINWSVSSETNYDKFTILVNGAQVLEKSGSESGTWEYEFISQPFTKISFCYTKDVSAAAGNDDAEIYNIIFTPLIQTGTITHTNVAIPCNTLYVGVENIARQIVAAYVGVEGKAQPFYSRYLPGRVEFSRTIEDCVISSFEYQGVSLQNHAIYGSSVSSVSDIYVWDQNLIFQTFERFSGWEHPASHMTAGQVGQYGLWAGPLESIDNDWISTDTVFVMSDDLVKGNAPNLSVARTYIGSASVGDYVIFAGGSNEGTSSSSEKSAVDAYDRNLVKLVLTNLPNATYSPPGASSGSHAIFPVAHWVYAYDGTTQIKQPRYLCAYNRDLTQSLHSPLHTRYSPSKGISLRPYAFFGGGGGYDLYMEYDNTAAVYTVNQQLTATHIGYLDVARGSMGGTALGRQVIFAGGDSGIDDFCMESTVDIFTVDGSKVEHNFALSYSRGDPGGATVGTYALFVGGNHEEAYESDGDVDVFTLVND